MSDGIVVGKKATNPNGNPAWEKGKSANPGGRPKTVKEVREFCSQYTIEAIEVALKIMRDSKVSPNVRLTAGSIILDRAIGKPTQTLSADPDGQAFVLQIVQLAGASAEQKEAHRRSDDEFETET